MPGILETEPRSLWVLVVLQAAQWNVSGPRDAYFNEVRAFEVD